MSDTKMSEEDIFKDVINPRSRSILEQVVQRSGLDKQRILDDFNEKVQSPYVIKSIKPEDNKTVEQARQDYVAGVLISKYNKRSPVSIFDVIPLGHQGVRVTKTKKRVDTVVAVVKNTANAEAPKIKAITFWDKEAENISSGIEFGSSYRNVMLSQNIQTGNLSGDNRSRFENPEDLNIDDIYKNLGITRSGYKELFKNPTKLNNMGYAIEEDIKMFEGFVKRYSEGLKKTANPEQPHDSDYWRQYRIHIKDAEGNLQTQEILPDGLVVEEEISCWVPKDQAGIEEGSLVQVIGIAKLGKDNQTGNLQVNFNAYHVRVLVAPESEGL